MAVNKAAIKKMWLAGVKRRDIAEAVGCSEVNVHTIVDELGLPRRKPGPRCRLVADDEYFRELWRSGLSLQKIADKLGVADETVRRAALAYDLPKRDRASSNHGPRPRIVPAPPARERASVTGFGSGTYADIAKVAKRRGWSHAKAQAEYHKARGAQDAEG
jgi:hypothetical protein